MRAAQCKLVDHFVRAFTLFLSIAFCAGAASAVSLDWSGTFRTEYVDIPDTLPIKGPSPYTGALPPHTLSGGPSTGGKEYFLNYLSLEPKIIISDGVNVHSKFIVLPNQNTTYANSQLGQIYGLGSNPNDGNNGSFSTSSTTSGNQQQSVVKASELYLTLNQEYGEFFAGRVPVQFGLGMTYSAGNGPFDHWADTRDMLGYKVIMGALSITPMFGREEQASPGTGQNIQDTVINVDYNNPETESEIAIWYQTRTSSQASNDAPVSYLGYNPTPGTSSVISGGWNTQDINVFFARGFESMKFRLEAGFRSGTTGVSDSGGNAVKVNGYGIATELDFPSHDAPSFWQIRAGLASGDNPNTSNFEGYYFNRNYDIAFLLMNHPLGNYDLFRSYAQRAPVYLPGSTTPNVAYNGHSLDEEVISNVYYLSPKYKMAISDHWDWTSSLTFVGLATQPLPNDALGNAVKVGTDVGEEFDTSFTYHPTKRIQWTSELGLLNTGGAFKGGPNNFNSGFIYGFQTRAAFTF